MIAAMQHLLGRLRLRRAPCAVALLGVLGVLPALAVSPEEAARLGHELTPLGGERGGSSDGSIPEWSGGLSSPAAAGDPDYRPGAHLKDPYAEDGPLFV